MPRARVRQIVLEDPDWKMRLTLDNEIEEDYFRDIANRRVKPIIEKLRSAYDKFRGRYNWNHIMGLGLVLYGLVNKGYDIDFTVARALARTRFPDLGDDIIREIVGVVEGYKRGARAGARR